MPSPFLSVGLHRRRGRTTDAFVVPNWSASVTVRGANSGEDMSRVL